MSRSSKSKRSTERFLGLPGSWAWPGWPAIWRNMWDTRATAVMFPVKVWGFGWSFNFGYATIRTKPIGKRIAGFVIGLLLLLAIVYVVACLALIVYYVLTTQTAPPPGDAFTFAIQEDGSLVPI